MGSNIIAKEDSDEAHECDYEEQWMVYNMFTMLLNTLYLPPSVVGYVQRYYPFFKQIYSKTLKRSYWANGCVKCGALQGDWFNFNEPHGAFCPVDEEEAAKITLIEYDFPFDFPAVSNYTIGDDFSDEYSYQKCR